MTAENQTIDTYQGDSFTATITVTEGGSAKTITGYTPSWAVARSAGGTPVLDDTDAGVDVTITDGANGEVTLTVDSSATESLEGDYVHELQLATGGNAVTVTRGRLTVRLDTAG